MNDFEKDKIRKDERLGYISAFGGIEIKHLDIEGPDIMLTFVAGAWNGEHTVHKRKIYSNKDGSMYFMFKGTRVKLEDMINQ